GGTLTSLGVATNGKIPIGSTGAAPVLAEITGTSNQVISTPGAGSITLSTPQDIHTGASPTFAGITLTNAAVIGLNSVVFQPDTDSTTFLQVLAADDTPIINVNTTDERVGIGREATLRNFEIEDPNTSYSAMRIVKGSAIGELGCSNNAFVIFGSFSNHPLYVIQANSVALGISTSKFVAIGGSITAAETLLELTHATPYLTLHNSTHEDTDGGRESRLIFKGEQSGGEETAGFQFEASHDGTGDDQKFRGVWNVNTGSGLVEGMRLDSNLLLTIAGLALTGLTTNSLIYPTSGGTLTSLGVATNGKIPIGSTGAAPVLAEITGTSNQVISTPGAGSITLSTPQDIHIAASNFTVAGATISDLTQGSVVFAGASGAISQDNSNLFWDDTNNRLGIGTLTIPHGGVGSAKFAIDGTNANVAGPHLQFTTTSDNYPLMQILNWRHDDISIRFDSYWDGANKSSDAGSNYAIFKVSDSFKIMYDSGVAKGGAIAWNDGIVLNTSGLVTFGGAINITTIAAEGSDVDKFLVSSSGVVKYRTGAQVLSDIGGAVADDTVYNATSWNTNTDAATKNAIRDKVETMDTAIGSNTTHRGSDGSDHSIVGSNTTAIALNTTHRSSNGSDHSYLDQAVTIAGSPTHAYLTLSNSPTAGTHAVNKDYVDGLFMGLDWQESVIDIANNTTIPPTEVTGDRYLLDNTGGGVHANWDGAAVNDIVEFDGTDWFVAYTALGDEGGTCWAEDEDTNYVWNGTNWVKLGSTVTHNNTSGLQGGTTNEYYHLTSTQHTEATRDATNSQNGLMPTAKLTNWDAAFTHVSADGSSHSAVGLNTTHRGLVSGNPHVVTPTDLSLNLVENTALSTWAGSTNLVTLGTIAAGTWSASTIAINKGGSGQVTAQLAINALSAVSAATNEHVLTKDTASGNAIWKVAASGSDVKVGVDVGATAG
ncbi:hypothetical protein LCGC14_1758100, partial [marine sediment metagenome]